MTKGIEDLRREFDEGLHETRRGHYGALLTYVSWSHYARRLNEAVGADAWSFRVLDHKVGEEEVLVLGEMTINDCTKQSFGGSSIARKRETGEALSIADELKAASSDALKRCAALFGLGLELYSDDKGAEPPENRRNGQQQAPAHRESGGSQRASEGTLTERQLNAIVAIGRAMGWTSDRLRIACRDMWQLEVEELSKEQASTFIGELKKGDASSTSRGKGATTRQVGAIFKLGGELQMSKAETRRKVSEFIKRDVDDLVQLTVSEASSVIDEMKARLEG